MHPERPAPDARLGRLGDDLVLLSVWQGGGRVSSPEVTGVALMGAELVRLAGSGRIDIVKGRVTVLDAAPIGDAEADAALADLAAQRWPPFAQAWCSRPRRGICEAYLARLAAGGVIYPEQRTRFGFLRVTRWRVFDQARAADARARLDAIAAGTGQVDLAQAAYGGLAHATGLAGRLYPGRDNRALRQRLEQIAEGRFTAGAAASHAAVSAALRAAVSAAQEARVPRWYTGPY